MKTPAVQIKGGDWVRYYGRDGLVIAQVEYVDVEDGWRGRTIVRTDRGPTFEDQILEVRSLQAGAIHRGGA